MCAPRALAQARQGRQIVAHGGSRGEAAVVNSSVRVSGRQSRLQPPIIYVARAGVRLLYCLFFPWLPPWAIPQSGTAATRLASARFTSARGALASRMKARGFEDESRGPATQVPGVSTFVLRFLALCSFLLPATSHI